MNSSRFNELVSAYPRLRVAVVGDFCLDRYLEIDPALQETSLETGLPVHNVVSVRAQPGGAGTVLNNLAALGIGTIYPVGFAGEDGEGYELMRALAGTSGVRLDYFVRTDTRRTFTYCKPLIITPGAPPQELNRLDSKNWTRTPGVLQQRFCSYVHELTASADAMVILSQVDKPDTGVVTAALLNEFAGNQRARPDLPVLADSRTGLANCPPLSFKMNAMELGCLTGSSQLGLEQVKEAAVRLACRNGKPVFVTLSEKGIIGASSTGVVEHVPILPVRGPVDIVGAGDAVSANLVAALAAGATVRESIELANAAASVVIHKLGTTGTATVSEIRPLLAC